MESTVVGDYVLGERLGGGGFGDVFAATHSQIGGEAAIKILHAYRCADPIAVTRFVAEARAVNKVRHPNIVDIFDFGELADGRHYFVMERLHGETLRAVLDRRTRLPREEAIPLLREIAAAVDAAHVAGITHRDIKPDNVFISEGGGVKLIDFGIAKLSTDATMTNTEMVLGTPAYMSPEQCRGGSVDERSDLYSFGALAYHILVGEPPFDGDPLALALHHLNDAPKAPSRRAEVSRAVDEPVLALLAKDPAMRPRPLVDVVKQLAGPARFRWKRAGAIAIGLGVVVAGVVGVRELVKPEPPLVIDPDKIVVRHIPLQGRINNILELTPDGKAVRLANLNGGVEQSLEDGTTHPTNYGASPSDDEGRMIYSSTFTAINPPGPNAYNQVMGNWPEPCGHSIAAVEHNRIIITDNRTLARRDAGPALGPWGLRWSSDCRQLIWSDVHRVLHLTDAIIGTSVELDLPVLRRSIMAAPAAFVGTNAIVYCKDLPGRVEATLHYLDGSAPDMPLRALPPDFGSCQIASTRDGRRVLVDPLATPITSRTFDPSAASVEIKDLTLAPNEFVEQFIDDNTAIVTRMEGNPPPEPVVQAAHQVPRHSRRVTATTSTPMTSCPGESTVIIRDGSLVHVVLDGTAIRLARDGDCSLVSSWSIPLPDAAWSKPSCVGTTCVITALDDRVHVYALDVGAAAARSMFDFVADLPVRDSLPVEMIALSPDKQHVVIMKAALPKFDVVELATNVRQTFSFGDGLDPAFEYPIWADASHFYVSTNGYMPQANAGAGVYRFDLSGHSDPVVTFPSYVTLSAVSPSGKRLAVRPTSYDSDQFVFDLPPFARR